VACFHLLHAEYMFPSVSWLGSSGAAWSYVFTQHTIGFSMAEGTTAGIALKAHYATRTTCNKIYFRSVKTIRHCTLYHQHATQLSILLYSTRIGCMEKVIKAMPCASQRSIPHRMMFMTIEVWRWECFLISSHTPPVGVRIRDAILVFNVLWLEGHLEPNCHFDFLNVP
jgi:hypothetical protein